MQLKTYISFSEHFGRKQWYQRRVREVVQRKKTLVMDGLAPFSDLELSFFHRSMRRGFHLVTQCWYPLFRYGAVWVICGIGYYLYRDDIPPVTPLGILFPMFKQFDPNMPLPLE
eukprot:TRINITY_DN608_c0_g1_i6.p1 TRINITY_DN608_c0_g1~~TRINITY_DN608_c0_g1_i6.p1  ORF type:complete len:114 (+),score=21.69 TRINITY_DN608_c0_g1_i6:72-413(+)